MGERPWRVYASVMIAKLEYSITIPGFHAIAELPAGPTA